MPLRIAVGDANAEEDDCVGELVSTSVRSNRRMSFDEEADGTEADTEAGSGGEDEPDSSDNENGDGDGGIAGADAAGGAEFLAALEEFERRKKAVKDSTAHLVRRHNERAVFTRLANDLRYETNAEVVAHREMARSKRDELEAAKGIAGVGADGGHHAMPGFSVGGSGVSRIFDVLSRMHQEELSALPGDALSQYHGDRATSVASSGITGEASGVNSIAGLGSRATGMVSSSSIATGSIAAPSKFRGPSYRRRRERVKLAPLSERYGKDPQADWLREPVHITLFPNEAAEENRLRREAREQARERKERRRKTNHTAAAEQDASQPESPDEQPDDPNQLHDARKRGRRRRSGHRSQGAEEGAGMAMATPQARLIQSQTQALLRGMRERGNVARMTRKARQRAADLADEQGEDAVLTVVEDMSPGKQHVVDGAKFAQLAVLRVPYRPRDPHRFHAAAKPGHGGGEHHQQQQHTHTHHHHHSHHHHHHHHHHHVAPLDLAVVYPRIEHVCECLAAPRSVMLFIKLVVAAASQEEEAPSKGSDASHSGHGPDDRRRSSLGTLPSHPPSFASPSSVPGAGLSSQLSSTPNSSKATPLPTPGASGLATPNPPHPPQQFLQQQQQAKAAGGGLHGMAFLHQLETLADAVYHHAILAELLAMIGMEELPVQHAMITLMPSSTVDFLTYHNRLRPPRPDQMNKEWLEAHFDELDALCEELIPWVSTWEVSQAGVGARRDLKFFVAQLRHRQELSQQAAKSCK